MKKALSLVLVLVLAFGLAAPTLAYEDTDPPMWQQWGYDSLEAYLTDWDETEEEYAEEVASIIAAERHAAGEDAWKDAYLTANPDFPAQAIANDVPPMWLVWGFDSPEEFLAFIGEEGQTYEDYIVDNAMHEIYWDIFYAEQNAMQMKKARVSMGGPEEGIGVMWADQFVQFPDAQPQIVNDRTMIPVRALMEQIGAEVGYDAGTVTLTLPDGAVLSFVVGETAVTVKKDGAEQTVEMDVAPFIEEDRTYVPLRFFTVALGYDVFWDDYYKTAVVLDPQAIIAEIDSAFTVLNAYLKTQAAEKTEKTEKHRVSAKLDGDLTIFDSMDGDKTGRLSLELSGLVSGMTADMHGKWDFAELIALVAAMEETGSALDGTDRETLEALGSSSVEVIMDLETGRYYLRSPAMSTISEGMIPSGAWIGIDANAPGSEYGVDFGELLAAAETETANMTVGKLLYSIGASDSVFAYSTITESAQTLAALVGDDRFAPTAGGHTLKLDTASIAEALGADLPGDGTVFALTLNLMADGSCSGSFDMMLPGSSFGTGKTALNMTFDSSKTDASLALTLHVRNTFLCHMTLTEAIAETGDDPRSEPPEGDTVIDIDDPMIGPAADYGD